MQKSQPKDSIWWIMTALLAGGILLRLVVFITAAPDNADPHYEVIRYIAERGELPLSNVLNQSYHPPLYYLLMTPLARMWPETEQPIHFASFLFSITNLILIRFLLEHPLVLHHRAARLIAFGILCFLPEFVMFSGFVSNDSLAFLIGSLLFWMTLRYLEHPSAGRIVLMGFMVGIGLLTKATFLLTGPALAILILIVESRRNWKRATTSLIAFCCIWAILGCYKFVENYRHFGRPFVHNLDVRGPTWEGQHGTWKGWQTVYDINVIKLIRAPILQPKNPFSYPLLMYATFWYPHIPNSSFHGSWNGYEWAGSIMYAMAIVPTLIFLGGVARGTAITVGIIQSQQNRRLVVMASMLLLFSNLAVVIAAGVKYDVWSCFQSRLCFQSIVPAIVLFGLGVELLPASTWIRKAVYATCWATAACGLLYFVVEIALVMQLLPPGQELKP